MSKAPSGAAVQSISASDLLKQQKQKQRELLEIRRRRADQIQQRVQQNSCGPGPSSSPGQGGLMSPRVACEAPRSTQSPTLGRGFSKDEDILFFENSRPLAPPPSALSLSAAQMAALKKLRAKGATLQREDPNAVKRKRSNDCDISQRVEKNLTSPKGTHTHKYFVYLFIHLHLH